MNTQDIRELLHNVWNAALDVSNSKDFRNADGTLDEAEYIKAQKNVIKHYSALIDSQILQARTNQNKNLKQLKSDLIDALDNHKRTLDYIVKNHAPRNPTNYEVYLRKAIEVDSKLATLTKQQEGK